MSGLAFFAIIRCFRAGLKTPWQDKQSPEISGRQAGNTGNTEILKSALFLSRKPLRILGLNIVEEVLKPPLAVSLKTLLSVITLDTGSRDCFYDH